MRKIVQAYLNQLIVESQGKIAQIKMVKSLGAASVGEAFHCKFYVMEKLQDDAKKIGGADMPSRMNSGRFAWMMPLRFWMGSLRVRMYLG